MASMSQSIILSIEMHSHFTETNSGVFAPWVHRRDLNRDTQTDRISITCSTMLSRFIKSFFAIIIALFIVATIAMLHPPSRTYVSPWTGDFFGEGGVEKDLDYGRILAPVDANIQGGVIMTKLGNATAKAELGRATWKLLHTMTLRYPEKPTDDEKEALKSYFYLFSRLYPCGECAAEFQQLLKKFPPQTSSRRTAATWLCHVHNQVNERLGKPEFDCAHLDETYDCGCGDEPVNKAIGDSRDDPMDLERDPSRDADTGVALIKGGR